MDIVKPAETRVHPGYHVKSHLGQGARYLAQDIPIAQPMADRNAPEPAGMPKPLPWAKELDVYAVKDDVKPVLRYAINEERKLRGRDQNDVVHPPQQIFVYERLR